MSSYKYKQTKSMYFGEKEKLFRTIECQLIHTKVMTELENNHWSNMVIIDLSKNRHCMLLLVRENLMINGTFTWSQNIPS